MCDCEAMKAMKAMKARCFGILDFWQVSSQWSKMKAPGLSNVEHCTTCGSHFEADAEPKISGLGEVAPDILFARP